MHWVVQDNLFKEHEWDQVIRTFERFNIPYSVHKVIPFGGGLIPEPEPQHQHVICLGSYSMRHYAKAHGWTPGVFDLFEQTFERQLEHWGDLMLNADSQVVPFKDVVLDRPMFIRPVDDSKYFAGQVFEAKEFHDWQHKVCVLGDDYGNSLRGDTLVQVTTPRKIYAEYRMWVVDQQIVSASLYKRGDKVIYSDQVDRHIHGFANQVLRIKDQVQDITLSTANRGWAPARAFVLDVCETPEGMRIVEINTINAAGFYAGNVQDIILAIDSMKF